MCACVLLLLLKIYVRVCVRHSITCCTEATALTTGPRSWTWRMQLGLGVTWLRPLPPSPSHPRRLTVNTLNTNVCHLQPQLPPLACALHHQHVELKPLSPTVCCLAVKNMSELNLHRQTPSPSLQSYGGYRTDHGESRWLQHIIQLQFQKCFCQLDVCLFLCTNPSRDPAEVKLAPAGT